MKVARSAQTIPDPVAYIAARRGGEPPRASTVRMAVRPPRATSTGNQACDVAWLWPPFGSAMTRKRANPAEVTNADTQAEATTSPCSQVEARTNEKTNSETRIELDYRYRAVVEGDGLEDEGCDHGQHPEEPERAANQIDR